MEPLNQKDRKKAFFNFLIFFSITAALLITTAFFSVEVPFKQNEQLRDREKIAENEKDIAETFVNKMNVANHLLDSLNKSSVNVDLVDGKLKDELTDMNAMIDKDSISNSGLYQSMIENLSNLRAAKKELRDAAGKGANAVELKQKVSELTERLDRANNTITQLQVALSQK